MAIDQTLDNAVRLEVYRFFVDQGRPPVPAEIAGALDTGQDAVEDSLQRLADGHVLVLAPGSSYIWMANPLSAIPTSFSVNTAGRMWFANCIWDALGVIAMLGGTGSVRTWCPDCREHLSVSVEANRLVSREGIAHILVPAAHWWDDIGFNCANMLLFRSEDHVEAWYRSRGMRTGAMLSLKQQWDLARIWYSDRLSAEWRRRTPEEAEAVFSSLGLSGPFWRLTA